MNRNIDKRRDPGMPSSSPLSDLLNRDNHEIRHYCTQYVTLRPSKYT